MLAPALSNSWQGFKDELFDFWPVLETVPNEELLFFLTPVLSMAHWVLTRLPEEFLNKPRLFILLAGDCALSTMHGGRWLQMLSWAMGRPSIDVCFTRLGHGVTEPKTALADIASYALRDLGEIEDIESRGRSLIACKRPANMVQGTWHDWEDRFPCERPDLCFLLHPDLVFINEEWVETPIFLQMVNQEVPIGAFSFARVDYLSCVEVLRNFGWAGVSENGLMNRWHPYPDSALRERGCNYGWEWSLQGASVPVGVQRNEKEIDNWANTAVDYISVLEEPDLPAWEKLGLVTVLQKKGDDPEKRMARLHREFCVDLCTGEVSMLFDDEVTDVIPVAVIPWIDRKFLDNHPGNDDWVARCKWAFELFATHIEPVIEEDELEMSDEEIEEILGPAHFDE